MNRLSSAVAAGLLASVVMPAGPAVAADGGARSVTVCSSCADTTLQEGLARLAPGGTLRVLSGVYRGPVVVDKTVHLVGVGRPVIDAGGKGTVVQMREQAAGSSIEGFTVRNSGENPDHEDSGIVMEGPRQTVRNNRVEDVLFGINARKSDDSRIVGNVVTGKDDLPVGEKGDGIKVWYSQGIEISRNTAYHVRDNLMWFSHHSTIRDNHFYDSRYGVHFMWSDDTDIERNTFEGNSVATYFMFSHKVRMNRNVLRDNRGTTGVGIGLRDSDWVTAKDNVLTHNRVGLWLFASPSDPAKTDRFTGNLFGHNDIGVIAESVASGDVFSGNDFVDNLEQVGGSNEEDLSFKGIKWTENGRGNYWSDYAGYDGDGDGVGDSPYAPRKTFEGLTHGNENFALLFQSPAAKAIDWAANAFPVFNATVPFEDPKPATKPMTKATAVQVPEGSPMPMIGGAGGLTLAGLALVGAVRPRTRNTSKGRRQRSAPPASGSQAAAISVDRLHKAYGDAVILDDLSFEVRPGEVVALWGDNGVGKTTVLRCLLGLVSYQGEARIGGWLPRTHPREALAELGHVSQEPAFHADLTVTETLEFYSKLHGADLADRKRVLELVGLVNADGKKVSELSGGMHRKLAVATALLGEPRVLLLDEPTANLDRHSRRDLVALLRRLKDSGIAMVLATHQADEVLDLADRVLKLRPGKAATVVDTAVFRHGDADEEDTGRRMASLAVPEGRREEAARLLLDAGIPIEHGGVPVADAGVPAEAADVPDDVRAGIPADAPVDEGDKEVGA